MVLRSTRTAKRAISSSSSATNSGESNRASSSHGSSTCTHRLRYFRNLWRSSLKSSGIGALSISAYRRCCFDSEYSERRYVSAPDTAVRITPRYAPPTKARSHCLTISEHHSESITPPLSNSSSREMRYFQGSCGSVAIWRTLRIKRRRAEGVDDTTDAIRAVSCIRFIISLRLSCVCNNHASCPARASEHTLPDTLA